MERIYLGKSTVSKYTKDDRPRAVDIVRRYKEFADPTMSSFIGFIADKLSVQDANDLYEKIKILGNQLGKHFFRIILNNDPNFNKVTLPNIDLFQQMYEKIQQGKEIDGQKLSSKELADAFVSSLEECIDSNFKAEQNLKVIAVGEPHPLAGIRRGLSDPTVKPYTPRGKNW